MDALEILDFVIPKSEFALVILGFEKLGLYLDDPRRTIKNDHRYNFGLWWTLGETNSSGASVCYKHEQIVQPLFRHFIPEVAARTQLSKSKRDVDIILTLFSKVEAQADQKTIIRLFDKVNSKKPNHQRTRAVPYSFEKAWIRIFFLYPAWKSRFKNTKNFPTRNHDAPREMNGAYVDAIEVITSRQRRPPSMNGKRTSTAFPTTLA